LTKQKDSGAGRLAVLALAQPGSTAGMIGFLVISAQQQHSRFLAVSVPPQCTHTTEQPGPDLRMKNGAN
jgi:hypothetical protein